MIWPLIEFGGLAFVLILAFLSLVEIAMLHKGEETSAIVIFIIAAAAMVGLVDGLPRLTWHYLAAYLLGAFVWLPTYWYLALRRNRRSLLKCEKHYRSNFGTQKNEKWLPKHPDYDALVANGVMWFFAAPIHCTKDWVNWIIDLFTGLMNKVQESLAVEFESIK